MPLGPFGAVRLDGVQFSTDPAVYEPLNWAKRFSIHPTLGGKVVIQDFGTFQKDNSLKLGSGPYNPLDDPVVQAIHTRYRTRGTSYSLTDWLNNQFTVFIKNFDPVPLKQGSDETGLNTVSLYTYVLDLHVVAIVKLFGNAFSGA